MEKGSIRPSSRRIRIITTRLSWSLPVHSVAFEAAFVYPFWHEPWPHNKFEYTQIPWCMMECRMIRVHCTIHSRCLAIAERRREGEAKLMRFPAWYETRKFLSSHYIRSRFVRSAAASHSTTFHFSTTRKRHQEIMAERKNKSLQKLFLRKLLEGFFSSSLANSIINSFVENASTFFFGLFVFPSLHPSRTMHSTVEKFS